MIQATEKIWHNGKMVPWNEANVHVMTHALHYGTSVFEGVRCYATKKGPAIFRLPEHMRRMFDSSKIYRMDLPNITPQQLGEACVETVRVNGLKSCYIRPVAFRGYGQVGVLSTGNPIEIYVVCWEWGKYLGAEAVEQGVDVCISSWTRIAPNTLPAMAKVAANYMNSQLIKMEAVQNGYAEGIALDATGYVSEGSGENVFLVKDGTIYTPTLGTSALPGITRHTVITFAKEAGIPVVEQALPREWLYIADELFFTGTAAEITPIRSVDRITVGSGTRGPITEQLQTAFNKVIEDGEDPHGWLTFL